MGAKLSRTAWVLIVGILLARIAIFMSYPFLAIHLEKLKFNALDIGIILGGHYLFAGIIGIFGGNIADQLGLKRTITLTLLIGAFSFWGLSQAQSFTGFLLCNLCLAIFSATFEPAATTSITRSLPSNLHALALRYRYIAINIGASVGPFAGAILASFGANFTFIATGILLLAYSLFSLIFDFEKKGSTPTNTYSWNNLKEALVHMKGHKAFLLLILGNLFINMTFCQIFSTLPQILYREIDDSFRLYSILLTVNPLTVIFVGLFSSHYLSKQNLRTLFTNGCFLLALAYLGFQFLNPNYTNYILCMILFTIGEIILLPTSAKFLVDLAPKEYHGTYLGSESCNYLGFFIGNLVGGFLLQTIGGVFLFCACCSIAGLFLYRLAHQNFTTSQPLHSLYQAARYKSE